MRAAQVWLLIGLMCLLHLSPRACLAAATAGQILSIEPGSDEVDPTPYAEYFLETNGPVSFERIRSPEYAAQFRPVERSEPSFGYRKGAVWLRFRLLDTSSQPIRRVLHMKTNFMTEIDVYQQTGSGWRRLLSQSADSTFGSREIPFHNLATRIQLDPREVTTVWIRFRSEGATALPLALETPDGFVRSVSRIMAGDFVFYGIMLMFLLTAVGASSLMPGPVLPAYFCYALSVLLYILQREGYAFQYLWPDNPGWNNFSSLPLGALLPAAAAVFALKFLETRGIDTVTRRVLIAIIAFQPLLVASALIFGAARVKQFAVLSTTGCILVFLLIGIQAWRRYGRQMSFFVIGWLGIVLASLVMTAFHNFGVEVSRQRTLDTMRIAMVFDAFMMGVASMSGLVMLQRERLTLLREKEASFRKNLELQARMSKLEERYDLATALARSSSRLVAETAHDLRQPLFALRTAMSELLRRPEARPDRVAQVEQSLRYIEGLVSQSLELATRRTADESEQPKQEAERICASRILSALSGIYAEDCVASGTSLTLVNTTREVEANPLVVLRILGNFISNAITHAAGAKVLVGARARGGKLVFYVLDNGPGISEAMLARARDGDTGGDACAGRLARGGQVSGRKQPGSGLGFSIVATLAREAGLEWSITSDRATGTCASLTVPLAP